MSQNPQSIVAMACTQDGKITSFFQSSPKDAPLPIHWTAHRHSVVIVHVVPLTSSSQDFANGRIPDPLVYMVTMYAALDLMYVDVVSCSSGHFAIAPTRAERSAPPTFEATAHAHRGRAVNLRVACALAV